MEAYDYVLKADMKIEWYTYGDKQIKIYEFIRVNIHCCIWSIKFIW